MVPTTSISSLIEQFGKLPLNDRSFAIDLMQRQMVEARREALALRAAQVLRNYKQGKVKRGTVSDLKKALGRGRVTIAPAVKPFLGYRNRIHVGKGDIKEDIKMARSLIAKR